MAKPYPFMRNLWCLRNLPHLRWQADNARILRISSLVWLKQSAQACFPNDYLLALRVDIHARCSYY